MARGSKSSYTGKQRRKAHHIEKSAKSRGRSSKTAKRIAYATINKYEGGGKKSGSGRGRSRKSSGAARSRPAQSKGGRRSSSSRSRSSTSRKRAAAGRKGGRARARSRR